ncbi:ferredoxin-NADP reductase [Shimia isoporae]|uniref:Ferredoxin-NADP reductase n=1 Tax=Shimia isoporae TaxID=647720 RepID=A0A4R1N0M7_9RHOB|nr:2Fe-2S iron-sulfur cluster-binding protein [Shimia isoporae]TCK99264.1 ferredoxin-NADP reductase [Shimia isoporae]
MAPNDIRSVIDGFDDARARMQDMARTGHDFAGEGDAVKNRINALHPKRLSLTVSDVIAETDTSRTLRLTPDAGNLPPFLAGQYVNVFVNVNGVDTARPFAISSAPQDRSHYDITVRKLPGGFVSPWLVEGLQIGAKISSSGPMGSFFVNPIHHGKDLVFLAGGSGVAPAISMIRDLAARQTGAKFHLIYGSRSPDDIIFETELQELQQANDFLTVTNVISEPQEGFKGRTGFIDAAFMTELCGDMSGKTVYLCGPPAMNEACAAMLRDMGFPDKRLHIEANGPPVDPTSRSGWPVGLSAEHPVTVTVKGHGSFETKAGEPLLNALEKAGYQIENACRSGECSLCRIKVLSGEVFNPSEAKLRQSDRRFGWVHSCVAYATTDVEILI